MRNTATAHEGPSILHRAAILARSEGQQVAAVRASGAPARAMRSLDRHAQTGFAVKDLRTEHGSWRESILALARRRRVPRGSIIRALVDTIRQ